MVSKIWMEPIFGEPLDSSMRHERFFIAVSYTLVHLYSTDICE